MEDWGESQKSMDCGTRLIEGCRGSTGYGRFDYEHFTVKRQIIIHPTNNQYSLVD